MTFDEFIKELAKLPKKGWRGRIVEGRIRLDKGDPILVCHCPLTAVGNIQDPGISAAHEYIKAKDVLGINYDTMDSIISAADHKNPSTQLNQDRRQQMLAVLKLEEAA